MLLSHRADQSIQSLTVENGVVISPVSQTLSRSLFQVLAYQPEIVVNLFEIEFFQSIELYERH